MNLALYNGYLIIFLLINYHSAIKKGSYFLKSESINYNYDVTEKFNN